MIDTAEKRRSASGVPFLPLGPGVTPNLSKDAEWRQESAWGYSGILVSAPVTPTPEAARSPGYSVSRTPWLADMGRYKGMLKREKQKLDFERIVKELVHEDLTDDEFLLVGAAVYYYGEEST